MDKPEKRIDLNSELGMTRRDLIRRGAIVGGTLLWVAPAIQSMAPKAFAQEAAPGSVLCRACRTDIVDPDGPGSQPPTTVHTEFGATTACCNCLRTPHSLSFCANNGFCLELSGQQDLPGACPP